MEVEYRMVTLTTSVTTTATTATTIHRRGGKEIGEDAFRT